jgi:hypothetical protein
MYRLIGLVGLKERVKTKFANSHGNPHMTFPFLTPLMGMVFVGFV